MSPNLITGVLTVAALVTTGASSQERVFYRDGQPYEPPAQSSSAASTMEIIEMQQAPALPIVETASSASSQASSQASSLASSVAALPVTVTEESPEESRFPYAAVIGGGALTLLLGGLWYGKDFLKRTPKIDLPAAPTPTPLPPTIEPGPSKLQSLVDNLKPRE